MSATIAPDVFRAAMSRLAGAVNVIATGFSDDDSSGPRGMTATAVCSLCAEPPSLIACLHRDAGTAVQALRLGVFSVNVLTERHLEVARTFAGAERFGADRFTVGAWERGRLGVPVLADALVAFECRVAQAYTHGTHTVLIGGIEIVRAASTEEPLVFHARRFVGLGKDLERRSA